MALGAAHAFAALLLEDPDLRAARLALDDGNDASVLDKRGAGDDFAAVLFNEQDLAQRELGSRFARRAVNSQDAAGRCLVLTSAGLDDCVHFSHLRTPLVYGGLRCL